MATSEKKISESKTNFEHRFIADSKELKRIVEKLKKQGKKIVLTQGVYDLIHQGHALYLEKARSFGDVLIVGVDSDELTRKRKGPNRPIVPQDERLKMLVHLRHVDIVTLREVHHGLGDLIRLICPDVLIISQSTKDFRKQQAAEYGPYCKKIIELPPQATTSTTARIRTLTMEGAEKLAAEISRLTAEFLDKIRETA